MLSPIPITVGEIFLKPTAFADSPQNSYRKRTLRSEEAKTKDRVRYRARKENPSLYLWMLLKNRAQSRGHFFDLAVEDLEIPSHCPVFGTPLRQPGTGHGNDIASVDRLIPELGYTKKNIRIISMRANRLKQDATLAELKRLTEWLEGEMRNV